jgi:CIC family chloride channel protein
VNQDPTHAGDSGDSAHSLLPQALLLIAAGLVLGALAGLLATAFHFALSAAERLRELVLAVELPGGWIFPSLLVAACAYAASYLVRRFAPEAAGSGVQHVEAVVRGEAPPVPLVVLPVKFVGGILAIGSGFALGREGPTVQMGATVGQLLARAFRFNELDSRALLAAGAGAGLAAAFNAPLAGVLFVFEELIVGFSLRVAIASLAACSAALAIMRSIVGDRPVFVMAPVDVGLFQDYLAFLVFGALIGMLGIAYNRAVILGLDGFERVRRIPRDARAAIVGALVGALAWFAPEVIGSGDRQIQQLLGASFPIFQLLLLFVLRFVLGPLSYAPGLPGGLFAPLLVVGAVAGVLLGSAMQWVLPHVAIPGSVFAAVGMGTLFVAVVRAPLTGIALAVEMTGATGIFIPLMTACATAVAVPAAMGSRPIYDMLRERGRTTQA